MSMTKDIAGVVEDGEAHVVLDKWQGRRRGAEFDIVHEQSGSTQREAGVWITRSSLVQPESPMRVSTPGKEALGQWKTRALPGLGRVAFSSGLRHESPS